MTSIKKYCYNVYGLNISSELECPELPPGNGTPDVHISFGKIPIGIDQHSEPNYFWRTTPDFFFFRVKDAAKYLVTGGQKILIEPMPNPDIEKIRLFLLGTCFGALLHQRNFLPIHGSGIITPGGCIVFAGRSGIGKSTLAGALMKKGYTVVADDICPVQISDNNRLLVHPGYPQLKVTRESAHELDIEVSGLRQVSFDDNKFHLPISLSSLSREPSELKSIYFLETTNDSLSIKELTGIEKFSTLSQNIYRKSLINNLGKQKSNFKANTLVCKQVKMYKVSRPITKKLNNDFANYLIAHFENNP